MSCGACSTITGSARVSEIGRVANGVLAVLPESARRSALADVAGKLRDRGWRSGVGGVASGAAGLRRTIREAARAVELGALLDRPRHSTNTASSPCSTWSTSAPRARSSSHGACWARSWTRGSNAVHFETLRALCRHGFSQKLAAAALGIHPHTLAYRVAQIRERHGIDLDDAESRLRVHLAVLIVAS